MKTILKLVQYKIIFPDGGTIAYPDIQLLQGECIGISATSGHGKTTLLDSLFSYRFSGERQYQKAELFGQALSYWHQARYYQALYQRLSYLPQFAQDGFNPKQRLRQTLELTLKSTKQVCDPKELHRLLERLCLDPILLERYPNMLSGGQKQRLLLLFAYLKKPALLVLDEPSSAIDLITLRMMEDFLKSLTDCTLLIVSHNNSFLEKLCSQVIRL